jgi:hypothetical protein
MKTGMIRLCTLEGTDQVGGKYTSAVLKWLWLESDVGLPR